DRRRTAGSAPLFFGGLDASLYRLLEQLPLQVASAAEDGVFAGIENRAVGCVQGKVVEFLTQGENAAQQGGLAFGDIRRESHSGHGNFRVLKKGLIPYTLNPAINTRENGYTPLQKPLVSAACGAGYRMLTRR